MKPHLRVLAPALLGAVLCCAVPAPAQEPADPDADWKTRLDGIDARLRRGEWSEALGRAREAVEKAMEKPEAGFPLGQAVARLALAEAGLGQEDDAIWHWHAAQNLYRQALSAEDLRTFGAPGELLARHPLLRQGDQVAGIDVLPLSTPGLRQPEQTVRSRDDLQGQRIAGVRLPKWLRMQSVIDPQRGRLWNPVVTSPIPGMIWEVLEKARTWRFEPARKDGAAVAVVHTLKIDSPPSERPLTTIAPVEGDLAEIEALLRKRQWDQAERTADRLWNRVLSKNLPTRGLLAVMMTLRALAKAGAAGGEDEGICLWQAAQTLAPSLYHADLSAYGEAGEVLERHRWGQRAAEALGGFAGFPEEGELTRPQVLKTVRKPQVTGAARAQGLEGVVITQAVIDRTGAVRDPRILAAPAGEHGLDGAALDALCSWRFQPARRGGQPVPADYVLSINFQITPP